MTVSVGDVVRVHPSPGTTFSYWFPTIGDVTAVDGETVTVYLVDSGGPFYYTIPADLVTIWGQK